jgi:hypothetical protein
MSTETTAGSAADAERFETLQGKISDVKEQIGA